MPRLKIKDIQLLKGKKKIVCLTAYTISLAKIIDQHVDMILIGDSLGNAIYGMKNTQSVTLNMMKIHGKIVCDVSKRAFTIIDMPYGTYRTKKQALINARKLLNYTKCQSIKLEVNLNNVDIINHLSTNGIKTVAHIGVTPQKYKNFNKIRSVGHTYEEQIRILKLAKKAEMAKSCLILLECVNSNLAKKITQISKVPTIGIGSSSACDGQVLVVNDILNTDSSFKKPKFVKKYIDLNKLINKAVKKFTLDVVKKKFPSKKNTYSN